MNAAVNERIPRKEWALFCRRFARDHKGSRITVDLPLFGNRGTCVLVNHVPLENIAALRDGKNVEIAITAGDENRRLVHRVRNPEVLQLARTGEGDRPGLEFLGANGQKMILRLEA